MGTLLTVFSGIAALMCLLVGFQLFYLESQIGQAAGSEPVVSEDNFRHWAAQAHTGAIMSIGAGFLIFLLGLRHLTATKQGAKNPPPDEGSATVSAENLDSLSVRVFEVDASDRSVEITPGQEDPATSEATSHLSLLRDTTTHHGGTEPQPELALEGDLEPPADPTDTIVQSIREASDRHQSGAFSIGTSRFHGFSFLSRLFRFGRRR